jgi:hypothetical protein
MLSKLQVIYPSINSAASNVMLHYVEETANNMMVHYIQEITSNMMFPIFKKF